MIGYHLTVLHYSVSIVLYIIYKTRFYVFSVLKSSFLDNDTPGTLWPYITVVLKSCTIKKVYCHCRLPLLLPTVAARKEKLSPTLHTGRWRHTSHSQLIPIFSSLRSWVLSYIQKVIKVDLFNFWFDKSWVQFIHLTKHKSQSHCYVACVKNLWTSLNGIKEVQSDLPVQS